MARLLEHERVALAKQFVEKVEHYNEDQLQNLISSFHREMANSRLPFPEDLEVNYRILAALKARIRELKQQESRRNLTPDEELKREAERLAKANGVSLRTAENVLRRRKDPLDVPRKDRRAAPAPEAAEVPRNQSKQSDERPDLRPYRVRQE